MQKNTGSSPPGHAPAALRGKPQTQREEKTECSKLQSAPWAPVEPFEYLPSDAQLALGSAATWAAAASWRRPAATAAPTHMVMGEKTADGLYRPARAAHHRV